VIEQKLYYSSPSWLLGDHLGSTSMVTDASGVMVNEVRYSAFGETRYQNGTLTTDYLYTGQRQEMEIGLYYYVARWYDPAIGRFIQADSVVPDPTSALGFDRYAYVNNNPVKYTDPSGHKVDAEGSYNPWHHTVRDEEGNDIPLSEISGANNSQSGEIDENLGNGNYIESEPLYYLLSLEDGGWYKIPHVYQDGFMSPGTAVRFEGSWEPWVGLLVDFGGILVDGIGAFGTVLTNGVLTPAAIYGSEGYGLVEAAWYTYNLNQGNYSDVYYATQQELLDAGSPIPFAGLSGSVGGLVENLKIIGNGYETYDLLSGPVTSPSELPYDFPVLGYHPFWYGNPESPYYREDWQQCPGP